MDTVLSQRFDFKSSNLAFPLLKKLSEIGDLKALKALKVFKEEIIYRFFHGTKKVQEFLVISFFPFLI